MIKILRAELWLCARHTLTKGILLAFAVAMALTAGSFYKDARDAAPSNFASEGARRYVLAQADVLQYMPAIGFPIGITISDYTRLGFISRWLELTALFAGCFASALFGLEHANKTFSLRRSHSGMVKLVAAKVLMSLLACIVLTLLIAVGGEWIVTGSRGILINIRNVYLPILAASLFYAMIGLVLGSLRFDEYSALIFIFIIWICDTQFPELKVLPIQAASRYIRAMFSIDVFS